MMIAATVLCVCLQVATWDDAFFAYYDPTSPVSFIVSYGLDPAYNTCQDYSNSIVPLVSNIGGSTYAWSEIIEMGVLKSSTHQSRAVDFVNYVFNDLQVQNQTIYQDWSMPANRNLSLPTCYYTSGCILPTQVSLYNIPLLSQVDLEVTLPVWLQQWKLLYQEHTNGTKYTGYINKGSSGA
jgi:ABC-type thiamine transport system substrate-binding protein